jgi:hypothetical protein
MPAVNNNKNDSISVTIYKNKLKIFLQDIGSSNVLRESEAWIIKKGDTPTIQTLKMKVL